MCLGHRARGRACDGPLDHATGKGRVELHKGRYHDAARVKRARVHICLVEAGTGGVLPPFVRAIGSLAPASRDAAARTALATASRAPARASSSRTTSSGSPTRRSSAARAPCAGRS